MHIKKILRFFALGILLAGCSMPHGRWSVQEDVATTVPAQMMYGTYDDASHRMAVLLPMSGDMAAAGRAIGTSVEMAALSAGAENLTVSFFDSARGADAIDDALAGNPEIIVGPLFANDARALRDAKPSSLPVLSFTSDATAVGDGVMTVALMPTNSVEVIVKEMSADNRKNFIILAPDTDSGHLLAGVAKRSSEIYNIPLIGAFFYAERDSESIKSATEKASMNAARPPCF